MRFLCNDKMIQTGQTFDEVRMLLEEYGFQKSVPEDAGQIIYHGKTWLKELDCKVVIHLYFSGKKEEIQGMVIHPFPIDYARTQAYLEAQYGAPDSICGKQKAVWEWKDGRIMHQIVERFGEEEMVYFQFVL